MLSRIKLIEDIKKTINEEINILTNKVKGSIDIYMKNILSQMNLDNKIEDLYKAILILF